MPVKKPLPGDLEPIERASQASLKALQLERLRWSLAHIAAAERSAIAWASGGGGAEACSAIESLCLHFRLREGRPRRSAGRSSATTGTARRRNAP